MSANLQITTATAEDAEQIARVQLASWRAAYAHLVSADAWESVTLGDRSRRWRRNLADGLAETLVATAFGTVVGFASVGASRDAEAVEGTGELWALYVDPDWWGRGVGWRLWEGAAGRLADLEFRRASLWVLAENRRGRNFYERQCLVLDPVSEQTVDFLGFQLPEVRYHLELPSMSPTG